MIPREAIDGILEECRRGADPGIPLWVWLQHLAARLRSLFQAEDCAIHLRQKAEAALTLWAYAAEDACARAISSRHLAGLVPEAGLVRRPGYMMVPVQVGNLCLGAVEVRRAPTIDFAEEDAGILEALAAGMSHPIQAVLATGCVLERGCEVYGEARQRLAELSVMHEVGRTVSSTLDLSQVLQSVTRLAATVLKARTAVLRLMQEEAGPLSPVSRFDVDGGAICAGADGPLAELVRQEKAAMLIPDLRQHPPFAEYAGGEMASALCAPLFRQGVVIGTLSLYDKTGEAGEVVAFEEVDSQLLATLCTQVVVAIENARLFNAAERRAAELTLLREIGRAMSSRLDLSAVLEAVVAGAMRLLGSQFAQILLWDEEHRQLRYGAARGPEAERVRTMRLEPGRGVSETVALTRQPMILDDYQASAYVLPEFADIVATITTPLLFGERLLGVLHAHTTQRGKRFTPDELRLLQMLADRAAIAIENARLHEASERRGTHLEALLKASRSVMAGLDLQPTLDRIVVTVLEVLQVRRGNLYRLDRPEGTLTCVAAAGEGMPSSWLGETLPAGSGVAGRAAQTRRPVWTPNVLEDLDISLPPWARDRLRDEGCGAIVAVPLIARDEVVGVLALADRPGRIFPAEDIQLLTAFADQAAIAFENARLFHETERLAQDNLVRLRKISILNEIGIAMQGTMHLDALLRAILTGVTFGGGLGFNRAILLLVDESRNVLEGRMGVGPGSGEEAARVWTALSSTSKSVRELIAERAADTDEGADGAFDRLARSLVVPLRPEAGVLALTALEGRPYRITEARANPRVSPEWEGRLDVEEFACVPLVAKSKVVGVIAVDNKFNRKPITDEELEFLSLFATQAGLAIESAQVYTHLEEASREIQRTHHELLHRETLAALGEMAAHVVHEIRNPLVSIGGFARRLVRRLLDREPEGQYAQIISREVDRLERIVRDVQGMSRDVRPALVDTDLDAVIQDCAVLFAERIGKQRVQLRMALGERAPILPLDPVQAKQAIVNLLANALDVMPHGGTLTITTRIARADGGQFVDSSTGQLAGTEPEGTDASTTRPIDKSTGWQGAGEWVEVSVGDTGGGIPPGILDRVFDPFFTTKEAGTGLGLTLVRRIARAHQGFVDVDNHLGEGVTFRLGFPWRPFCPGEQWQPEERTMRNAAPEAVSPQDRGDSVERRT